MRLPRFCCLIFLLFYSGALPSRAQEIDVTAMARSFSAVYFLRTVCPRYLRIDPTLAAKTNEGFLIAGKKAFGQEQMKAAVLLEVDRRRKEISATGEAQWCSYQRAAMIEYGLPELFR